MRLQELVADFLSNLTLASEADTQRLFLKIGRFFVTNQDKQNFPDVVEYGLKIDPQTGLTHRVLASRAVQDLSQADGVLHLVIKNFGRDRNLANFFESEFGQGEKRSIFAVIALNRAVAKKISSMEILGAIDVLVEAGKTMEKREKDGQMGLLAKRSEMTPSIAELINRR